MLMLLVWEKSKVQFLLFVEFFDGSFAEDFFFEFVELFKLFECDCIISGIGFVMFRFLNVVAVSCLLMFTFEVVASSTFLECEGAFASASVFWFTFSTSGAEEKESDLS